jgi:ribonuclease HI
MKPPKLPSGRLLFDAPEQPRNIFIANVDGASRGNPGPASYAVIVRGPDGAVRFQSGKYIGRVTNNVAEYYALITALDYATSEGIDRLLVRSDSELLVRQMQGRYKVNSPDLRPLHERARKLAHGLAHFSIEHVPRERNREADELANIALDRTTSGGAAAQNETRPIATTRSEKSASSAPASLDRTSAATLGAQRFIRARYAEGTLHPLEPLDLAENEIVEIAIRRPR